MVQEKSFKLTGVLVATIVERKIKKRRQEGISEKRNRLKVWEGTEGAAARLEECSRGDLITRWVAERSFEWPLGVCLVERRCVLDVRCGIL